MAQNPSYEKLKQRVKQLEEQNKALAHMEKSPERASKERLEFERLLTELSAVFVKIPADEVDRKIEAVLQNIGEILGFDRTDFVQRIAETGRIEITHSWTTEGIQRYDRIITDELYPWFTAKFRNGEDIFFSTDEMPQDEASRDIQSLEDMGIKSGMIISYQVDDAFACAIAFGSHSDYRLSRPEGTIQRLRLLGEIIFNALLRKQQDVELRKAYEEIQALKNQLQQENIYLREKIETIHKHDEIIGNSTEIVRILEKIEQVAPTDSSVLITGETGTGKELVARAIHNLSSRKDRAMITVNCAALPAALVESELFGRQKGAYTGADTEQPGRFEVANGSTIFLDEIGELPPDIQVKLLRVLQQGEFERLGSPRTIEVDVRVIAATNKDLSGAIQNGVFREDLYYRLNVFPIHVPALRERPEDIIALTSAFIKEFSDSMGKRIDAVSKSSFDNLQRYFWPGNVRELRNVIERAMITSKNRTLHIEPPGISSHAPQDDFTLKEYERRHILNVLENTYWRIRGPNGAAQVLGLHPSTLYSRMKKLGIRRPI